MNETNKSNRLLLIMFVTIVLLLLSNIFFIYKFFTTKKEKIYIYTTLINTEEEKQKIEAELKNMLDQYNQLKINNDTLTKQLEYEKNKIKELLEEIKKVKSASYYQINQYKKEVETLRNIMKSYIAQIDSLNTRNKLLTEENRKVKSEYQKVVTEKELIEKKANELTEKVEIAKTLRAINIVSTGINDRGKEITKAKRVEKIRVCFTITENKIVTPGPKIIYIRISGNDNKVLPNPDNELFYYLNDSILYSAKREIDYQNADIDVCIYWKNDGSLVPGNYNVDIFCEGKLIGSDTFMLK